MTWKPDRKYTEKQLEKALNKAAVEFEEKVLSGEIAADRRLKLVDFIPQYMESAKLKLEPTTIEEYTRVINKYILPALGHLRLKDIRPAHIQKFVNMLSSGEYRQDGKTGALKPASVKRYYAVLQSVLSAAYRLELLPSNPTDSGKITLPTMEEQKEEVEGSSPFSSSAAGRR